MNKINKDRYNSQAQGWHYQKQGYRQEVVESCQKRPLFRTTYYIKRLQSECENLTNIINTQDWTQAQPKHLLIEKKWDDTGAGTWSGSGSGLGFL